MRTSKSIVMQWHYFKCKTKCCAFLESYDTLRNIVTYAMRVENPTDNNLNNEVILRLYSFMEFTKQKTSQRFIQYLINRLANIHDYS